MKQILSFFLEQNSIFYLKILGIIIIVAIAFIFFLKIMKIVLDKNQESKFEKKQEKIKRNKKNISELNKRAGISGRISSAAFTDEIDMEDIKENNNVDLRIHRASKHDFDKN